MTLNSWIDHLVIAAESLDQGVQWCEATLGLTPVAGGEHPLMGTHNRLLSLASDAHPRAYLEIIAINPKAEPPKRKRWFDLDEPDMRAAIHAQPRLIHFVAATRDAASGVKALQRLGIDRGPLVHAQRPTPAGMLRWQISVRDDGQRLFYGGLPTLIEWGDTHPADMMPPSGLVLQSLQVSHPRAADLQEAHEAVGLQGVGVRQGPPDLRATFATPTGTVVIDSAAA